MQRLARACLVALHVQKVVSDLESKPHIPRIAAQAAARLGRNVRHDSPRLQAKGDESARFQLLQPRDGGQVKAGFLRFQIHPLDRKSVVSGKSVSVRVDLGGSRSLNKKKQIYTT